MEAAFYMLQTMVAAMPYSDRNWNALSIAVYTNLGDLPVAFACCAIAKRLLEVRGLPSVAKLDENARIIDESLARQGIYMKAAMLWEQGGGRAAKVIRTALTTHHGQDIGESRFLLSDDSLEKLVALLVNDGSTTK
eukprot:TRINITY_DN67262_c0_g1_i1.p1 TRINITY_DN67262_c0_g1~~TRINITY_DN67262_c0_g1_i1.p1  ORF type:complete len:146 (-),score=26.81 TRINITY_DN67262_c0_g1_i1:77-484(-)